MAYKAERYPGEIHLYAATLDDPENYAPQCHVHAAERLPWFDVRDELKRYEHSGSRA